MGDLSHIFRSNSSTGGWLLGGSSLVIDKTYWMKTVRVVARYFSRLPTFPLDFSKFQFESTSQKYYSILLGIV